MRREGQFSNTNLISSRLRGAYKSQIKYCNAVLPLVVMSNILNFFTFMLMLQAQNQSRFKGFNVYH